MLWRMVEHGMGVQQTFRDQMTSRIDISGSPTMAGGLFRCGSATGGVAESWRTHWWLPCLVSRGKGFWLPLGDCGWMRLLPS